MKFFLLILFISLPFVTFGDETAADTTQEQFHVVKDTAQEEIVLNSELSPEKITNETMYNDSLLSTESHMHTRLSVIRREHDYKRQTWMAVGMMTFVAIILGTSQSWNPR